VEENHRPMWPMASWRSEFSCHTGCRARWVPEATAETTFTGGWSPVFHSQVCALSDTNLTPRFHFFPSPWGIMVDGCHMLG
jgi:hypothetical protein